MITEFKWVSREPMRKQDSDKVCQWLLTLRCYAWRDEKKGEPEAIAFRTETVPCYAEKPLKEYTPNLICEFSEALMRIRKWDKNLISDVERQLYPKVTFDGWNNETLSDS